MGRRAVFKELEDVVRPEQATAGAATFRYDSSLVGIINPITGQQITKGWIPQGRDTALEQYMIAHLLSRCGQRRRRWRLFDNDLGARITVGWRREVTYAAEGDSRLARRS